MPKWIHDRADRILADNPGMPKSEAFGIATQQAYGTGKQPKKKGWGTPEGKAEALKKYPDKPKYQKSAGLIARTLVSQAKKVKKKLVAKKVTDIPDPGEEKTAFWKGFEEELEKIGKRLGYVYTPQEEDFLRKRRALVGAGVGALGGAGLGAFLGHRHDPAATAGGALAGALGGGALGALGGALSSDFQADYRAMKRGREMAKAMGFGPEATPVFARMVTKAETLKRHKHGLPMVDPALTI